MRPLHAMPHHATSHLATLSFLRRKRGQQKRSTRRSKEPSQPPTASTSTTATSASSSDLPAPSTDGTRASRFPTPRRPAGPFSAWRPHQLCEWIFALLPARCNYGHISPHPLPHTVRGDHEITPPRPSLCSAGTGRTCSSHNSRSEISVWITLFA